MIKKREDAGTKHFSHPNAFIECSNTMDDVYENTDDYNPSRKRKILILLDDKKFQSIIKELFIRYKKVNVSLVFITQSHTSVPKDVRLNSTQYLIMKISNRKELQILQLIILQIITILWGFTENAQQIHIPFWQLILRYQQMILEDLEKICFLLIKVTVTDQIKILDRKIKQNEA